MLGRFLDWQIKKFGIYAVPMIVTEAILLGIFLSLIIINFPK